MNTIQTRLNAIKHTMQRIQRPIERTADSPLLLAVSKTWSASVLREAYQAGQYHFGENYLQEAVNKITELSNLTIEWHFIGAIQSNKTRDIARYFAWVQSIDRLKIAQRLATQRPDKLTDLNICIQVNIDNELTKSGVTPTQVLPLAEQLYLIPRLRLRGLMIIPAKTTQLAQQRNTFKQARALFEQLAAIYPTVDTLSMGMTHDMTTAIEEGSTMVRIGTGLFGKRVTS